jgi:hypothetical protein
MIVIVLLLLPLYCLLMRILFLCNFIFNIFSNYKRFCHNTVYSVYCVIQIALSYRIPYIDHLFGVINYDSVRQNSSRYTEHKVIFDFIIGKSFFLDCNSLMLQK